MDPASRAPEPRRSVNRPLPLVPSIVYGPLRSRRLGLSLGINLLPATIKVCSFDCVYCHCGYTDHKTLSVSPSSSAAAGFPSLQAVTLAVEQALYEFPDLDSLTFSGNGEPTLHPYFPDIAAEVYRLRGRFADRHQGGRRPSITLFSNASTVTNPEIRKALRYIDRPILKLDAGDAATFRCVNRPAEGITLDGICDALHWVTNCVIQSVMFDGDAGNVAEAAFRSWVERLAEIAPTAVQLYSTDYPVPAPGIRRVPAYRLRRLAEQAEAALGLPVRPYWIEW